MSELREQLLAGAAQLQVELDEPAIERLLAYVAELLNWNRRINLTAITRAQDVITQHILDSLAVLPYIRPGRLLDVGSGGGLPGLPLAIARPQLCIYSIDSRYKKIAFQRHVARQLDLPQFHPVCARVEQWQADAPFGQVISRAFSSLGQFVTLSAEHLEDAGELLAMKGQAPADELRQMPEGWRLVTMPRLSVPGLAAQRHLVIMARE